MAVQMTIGIAQIVNFFTQRSITFKSNSNIWVAAFWYVIAYILITIGAAAAQGFYKAPIINSAISFGVFYPIFNIIFKRDPAKN